MSPMYSYYCPKCGVVVLDHRTMDERDKVNPCLFCDVPLKRDLGFGSVAFKGSGFYSTDK